MATVKCDCGEIINLPLVNGEYDTMSLQCPNCKRKATHSNCKTGEVYSWSTLAQINNANEEYHYHQYTSDMNTLCGRGNW